MRFAATQLIKDLPQTADNLSRALQSVPPGLPEQKVEVVTFYTDMRRIPLGPVSVPAAGAAGSTPGSTPGTGNTSIKGTTK